MTARHCTLAALIAASFAMATAHAEDSSVIGDTSASATGPVVPADFGDAGGNLVYTPVAPCRLLDTRVPSARSGPLAPDTQRDFLVFDADLDAEQGGNPLGCNLPAEVEALAINLVSVDPAGPGFIVAWTAGQPRPLAASLNLIPGQDLANQVSIGVNNDPGEPDMSIYSWAQVDVVADVVGYYARPEAAALRCVTRHDGLGIVIDPGERVTVETPRCIAPELQVSGHCNTFGSEDLRVIDDRIQTQAQLCTARNEGSEPLPFRASLQCCHVPGR